MKIIYFKIAALIFSGIFLSCEDKLNLAPQNNLSLDNFFQSQQDLEQALVGVYDALQETGQYGLNFIYFMEVRSDNSFSRSITNSGGEFGDIELFRDKPTNSRLNATWSSCYRTIQRANVVISRAPSIDMEVFEQGKIVGEAKVLRALTYFNLVRLWGGVPIMLNETKDPFDFVNLERSTVEDVYQVIEQDLLEAIASLPSTSNSAGRIVQNTARSLLGKVYLTLKKHKDVASQLKEVIMSDQYRLQSDYNDIFLISNENNTESIFEIQYTSGSSNEGSGFANYMAIDPIQVGGNGTALGDNIPTPDIVDLYRDDDARKSVNIGELNGRTFCAKYIEIPNQNQDGDKNFIVLRYADVLLMYAEALNEIGYQADGVAFDYLNQVRSRAIVGGEYSSTDLPDQTSFREAIALERQLELAFENHRWFDLLRTNEAIKVMGRHTLKNGVLGVINENKLLFPIPQNQINSSKGVITKN